MSPSMAIFGFAPKKGFYKSSQLLQKLNFNFSRQSLIIFSQFGRASFLTLKNWQIKNHQSKISENKLSIQLKYLHFVLFMFIFLVLVQPSYAIIPFGFIGKRVDKCAGVSVTPGTVCLSGTIFLGTLNPGATSGSGTNKYMTTPGGCGDINVSGGGSGLSGYALTDFTPTCSGSDTLAKFWNNGSSIWYDFPELINYVTTGGPGNGAINTDQFYGDYNTAKIVAITAGASGGYHAAARYCDKLSFGGYTDWYLPNRYELNLFWINKDIIPGLDKSGSFYWSSTENDGYAAWVQRFNEGSQGACMKNNCYQGLVRCVRRF